uniref:Fibrinogen C domain containing 1 n=1 Tax=Poecilia reticulata TaxID=8081 RepID=A0A3P9PQ09_POERE
MFTCRCHGNRGGASTPAISAGSLESGALVTISRVADGEPVSVFLDPSCPDLSQDFLRLEALHSSLLHALTNHNADDHRNGGAVQKLGDDLKALSGHAHNLRLEADSLKRGQGALDQRMDRLQSEQSRIIQVESRLAVTSSASTASANQAGPGAVQPRDCSDVLASGVSVDGVYSVFPTHDPEGFMVYCDMSTDGGGWTVIQRREDGSTNFFRGWGAYRDGFGTTTGEHWLGGSSVTWTNQSTETLTDQSERLCALIGCYRGCLSWLPNSPLLLPPTGDSLLKHSGMRFTTKDRDQDQSENNCAAYYQGAWWYRNCHTSNLNGQYLRGGHASYADGVEWSSWTGWQYSLRFTEMKIRPRRPES